MERLPPNIHESWHQILQPLFDDPKMNIIRDELLPNCKYCPNPEDIFNVFKMPLQAIKVVIIGQDPYFNGEAIGYAFAVASTTKIPPSLEIIKREIIGSKVERDSYINIDSDKWRELKGWRNQGVFLLNAALTVEWKNPNSHAGYWQWFTREVVKAISASSVYPVWLLWGSKAKAFRDYIKDNCKYIPTLVNRMVLSEINFYLEGNHPAAEARPDSQYKFTGCNHFRLCNDILKAQGKTIINW